MTQQDTAAIARSFFESWNERNYDKGTSLIADDGELVEIATAEKFQGPEGLRQEYDKWAGAFPDGRVEILNSFAAGDWVAIQSRFRGTNTGTFTGPMGEIPPTGKSLTFDFCSIAKVQNGRLKELHHYHDTGTIAQQLGLTPAGAAASA